MLNCPDTRKKVIALGFFDGVHLGHQVLLRRTVERARALDMIPAAFTFDRAPRSFITGQNIPLLTTVEERKALIHSMFPIDELIVEPFNHLMMTTDWKDFFQMLATKHNAGWLVAGEDYTFGYKNQGQARQLQQLSAQYGIGCDIISYVKEGGERISSTRIRRLLMQGDVAGAEELLGHPISPSAYSTFQL